MRFIKIFAFLFLLMISLNVNALTNNQRSYLIKEKGYTPEQIQAYEKKVSDNQAAVRAGKSASPLSTEEMGILNAAKTTQAIQYGVEPGVVERFSAWTAEKTGIADKDITGTLDTIDSVGQGMMYTGTALVAAGTGFAAGTAIAGALGGGALASTAGSVVGTAVSALSLAAGNELADMIYPDNSSTYNRISDLFRGNSGGCWFCSIFERLFNAINSISTAVSGSLRSDFIKLLELAILFYILFKVLKAVISFGEIDPKQFISDLFMPILKAMIAVILLYNLNDLYHYIVNPLTELSIGFASNIQTNLQRTGTLRQAVAMTQQTSGFLDTQLLCTSSVQTEAVTTAVFDPSVNSAIQCFLKTISSQLINYMAISATFIHDSFKVSLSRILPNFQMLFVGVVLFVPLFMVFIGLPFKLLDSIFRLMFVSTLMPLWIVLWVLPVTQGYAKKAFDMFLNVLVTFICLSVILVMVLILLGTWTEGIRDYDAFLQLLSENRTDSAYDMINFGTGAFFKSLAMTILALSLMNKVDDFVNHFVGGAPGGGIGANMTKLAMTGVGLVGSKVAAPLASKAAKKVGKGIGAAADEAWQGVKSMARKSPYAAGYAVGATMRRLRGSNPNPSNTGANPSTEGSGQEAEQPQQPEKKTEAVPDTATQKEFEKLRTSSPSSLDALLKNPTALGTLLSTISGGAVNPALATAAAKSITSTSQESLANGNTKESTITKYTDAVGRKIQEQVETIVRDKANNILSTISYRELIDPETKQKAAIEIERDVDGKLISFAKQIKDENNQVIEHIKIDAKTGQTTDLLNKKS